MKRLLFFLALLLIAWLVVGSDGRAQSEEPPPGEPLETFVPSEKLPADEAISFPADI